jgi:probable HAF family extracellular repeat protein
MYSVFQSMLRRLLPPALALATSCAMAAPMYDVKVIAPPEPSGEIDMFWYSAIDLNNDGKSLSHRYQYMNPYSSYRTFDKHGNGLGMPLAETPPSQGAEFVGLNNWGDVIGSVTHSNWIWMGTVLKDQGYDAEIHGLPDDIYGGFFSDAYAYDANDVGQVVGRATSSTDGRQRAYLWQNRVMVEIGTFGGPSSSASAINERGVVVGRAGLADGTAHAFAYRNGRLHDLGTLGGPNSSARNINNKGQIVGTAQQADGVEKAFLYSDRVMKPLPTPDGASASAWSINRSGFAVGAYRLDDQSHAFLYDGVAVHRLNDLIDQAEQRPWTIESAVAINDKGWILCNGRKAGDVHATVLMLKPRP